MYPIYQTDLQAQPMVSRCRHAPGSLKYRPGSPSLDPDPCPRIDTGSSCPCLDKEEQIASVCVPLTLETVVSHNSGILVSEGNLVSHVQAGDNGNTSSTLTG